MTKLTPRTRRRNRCSSTGMQGSEPARADRSSMDEGFRRKFGIVPARFGRQTHRSTATTAGPLHLVISPFCFRHGVTEAVSFASASSAFLGVGRKKVGLLLTRGQVPDRRLKTASDRSLMCFFATKLLTRRTNDVDRFCRWYHVRMTPPAGEPFQVYDRQHAIPLWEESTSVIALPSANDGQLFQHPPSSSDAFIACFRLRLKLFRFEPGVAD